MSRDKKDAGAAGRSFPVAETRLEEIARRHLANVEGAGVRPVSAGELEEDGETLREESRPQEQSDRELLLKLQEEIGRLSERADQAELERDDFAKQLQASEKMVEQAARRTLGDLTETAAVDAFVEAREEMMKPWYKAIHQAQAEGQPLSVILSTHPEPNQNYPVEVSVNGHRVKLPRGVPVDIPAPHLEVLQRAYLVQSAKEVGADGNPRLKNRIIQMYPFQVVRGPQPIHSPAMAS